jgi:hypothetical protein
VIVLNEAHPRRLVREYIRYYHEDRIHDALNKDTPEQRPVQPRKTARSQIVAISRVGGLHHRYTWNAVSVLGKRHCRSDLDQVSCHCAVARARLAEDSAVKFPRPQPSEVRLIDPSHLRLEAQFS